MRAIAVRAGFATIPHINAKSQFKPAPTNAKSQFKPAPMRIYSGIIIGKGHGKLKIVVRPQYL
jgi:hypothetical protein